jgi:hypothetical protein
MSPVDAGSNPAAGVRRLTLIYRHHHRLCQNNSRVFDTSFVLQDSKIIRTETVYAVMNYGCILLRGLGSSSCAAAWVAI